MGKVTTHVLDLAAGIPAAGMLVELHERTHSATLSLAVLRTNTEGRCPQPLLEGPAMHTGCYSLTFHVADYFRARGLELPEPPFLHNVVVEFGVADRQQTYHVPLLVSPWSYSSYRGS